MSLGIASMVGGVSPGQPVPGVPRGHVSPQLRQLAAALVGVVHVAVRGGVGTDRGRGGGTGALRGGVGGGGTASRGGGRGARLRGVVGRHQLDQVGGGLDRLLLAVYVVDLKH